MAPERLVYNFAFGSNLSTAKLEQRGIFPRSKRRAVLHGFRLCFNQAGFPPIEPSFANAARTDCSGAECHGVVYAFSENDFLTLCNGEGVGSFYDVKIVSAELYEEDAAEGGASHQECTLFVCAAKRLTPGGANIAPSRRYKELLVVGAREAGLRPAWQARLAAIETAPPPSALGAWIFRMRFEGHLAISRWGAAAAGRGGASAAALGALGALNEVYSASSAALCAAAPSCYIPVLLPGAIFGAALSGWRWAQSQALTLSPRRLCSLGPLGLLARSPKAHAVIEVSRFGRVEEWARTLDRSGRNTMLKQVPRAAHRVRTAASAALGREHFGVILEHERRALGRTVRARLLACVRFLAASLMVGTVDEFRGADGELLGFAVSVVKGGALRAMWFYQLGGKKKALLWFAALRHAVERAIALEGVHHVDLGPSINDHVKETKARFGAHATREWRAECGYDEGPFVADPVMPLHQMASSSQL